MNIFCPLCWLCALCLIKCHLCNAEDELRQKTMLTNGYPQQQQQQQQPHQIGFSPIVACVANCRKRHLMVPTRDYCYRKVCRTITAAYEEAPPVLNHSKQLRDTSKGMTKNATISEAYAQLTSDTHQWALVFFATIYTMLAICGICLNISVIFVTIRSKHLTNSANKLLALYSLCEMVSQCGHFLFTYSMLSGHYLMPYELVLRLLTPSLFAFYGTSMLLLCTAIDRLIQVVFPCRKFKNISIYTILLFAFGLTSAIYNYLRMCQVAAQTLITCTMNDIGMATFQCSNSTEPIFPAVMNLIYLLTISIYIFLALFLFFRKAPANSNSHQTNIRIFRALFIIIFVNVGGYLLKFVQITVLIPLLQGDIVAIWEQNQIFGILLNISAASNAPILYWTSKEYHNAFVNEWKLFKNFFDRIFVNQI